MSADFASMVSSRFESLLSEHGFEADAASATAYTAGDLRIEFTLSHNGELEVRVYRATGRRWEGWTFAAEVGRVSIGRLLDLAKEQLSGDPRILSGDATFYEDLAAKNRALSAQWTAYYSGKGPNPNRMNNTLP